MPNETLMVMKRLREHPEDSWTLDRYLATGGYENARKAITGMSSADLIALVKDARHLSALRGHQP
jgi:NADH:ubiquinone oxidoreductase subunit F (NADH-binding)